MNDHVGRLGSSFSAMTSSMRNWGSIGVAAVAGVALGLGKLVKGSAVSLDSLDDLAKATGTTTQQIEALQLVATKAGDQGFEAINKALERTTKAMGQAQITGDKSGGDALFKAMDIDVTRFKDPIALMGEIGRQLDRESNSAIKAARAAELWGKSWASVLPTMANLRAEMAQATKDIAGTGGFTSQDSIDKSNAFLATLGKLQELLSRIGKTAGANFGAALIPAIEQLTAFIGQNMTLISEGITRVSGFIRALAQDLINFFILGSPEKQQTEWGKAIIDAVIYLRNDLIPGLTTAFQTMLGVFNQVAAAFNAVFGTQATGGQVAIVVAVGLLTGAFTALGAALTLLGPIITVIVALLSGPAGIVIAAGLAGAAIGTFAATWQPLRDVVNGVITFIIDKINTMIGWIQKAINLLQSLGSKAPVGGMPGGMAGGGRVPGSGIGDTVPAMLTPGEFVTRRAAVAKYGTGLFQALNSGAIPRGFFRGLGFAAGGLVEMPRGFADGGLATATAGGRPVHLHLGGKQFALSGSESVVGALVTEAHHHKMRAAGTKPSWYGGGR